MFRCWILVLYCVTTRSAVGVRSRQLALAVFVFVMGAFLLRFAHFLPRRDPSCLVCAATRMGFVSVWRALPCIQVDGKVRTDVNFPAGFMGESNGTTVLLWPMLKRLQKPRFIS